MWRGVERNRGEVKWEAYTQRLRNPSDLRAYNRMQEVIRLERQVRSPNTTFGLDIASVDTDKSSDRGNPRRARPLIDRHGRIRIINLETNYTRWISPSDPRYQAARRRLRKIETSLGANYLNYVQKGPQVQKFTIRRAGRGVMNFARFAKKRSWFIAIAATAGTVVIALKDKTVSAAEAIIDGISELAGQAVLNEDGLGDLPAEELLDNLKEAVKHLSSTDPNFSRIRPQLVSDLNEVSKGISNDSDLEQQEKARLLAKVREIQIALPAPQIGPSSTRRRNSRKVSRGIDSVNIEKTLNPEVEKSQEKSSLSNFIDSENCQTHPYE